MTEAAATTISKREQKRQARLAKELAEKSNTNPDASSPAASSEDPTHNEKRETSPTAVEPQSSPFVEPVQKRIRNYLKKKQKIDALIERSNDPEEYKKLNKDQLEQLARRDQILAPLKELQNLSEQFVGILEESNNALKSEAAETSKAHTAALEAAKAEGVQQGRKTLSSLIAYLGYVSKLRETPTEDKDYNSANETLLSVIYLGGDSALEAADHLNNGSDELIDGTTVAYKQVHDAIRTASSNDSTEDAVAFETTGAESAEGTNHIQGSNLVTLSELSKRPISFGAEGISFLNESEIEGSALPESIGEPINKTDAAPGQTVVDDTGNKAAAAAADAAVSWDQLETPRTNWADEDDVEQSVPVASSPDVISTTPVDDTLQGGLQPLSSFQTIEKKHPRDNARGRGRGRGRGDKSGRGRGEGRGGKSRTQ